MLNGISKICEGVIVDDLNNNSGDLFGNTVKDTTRQLKPPTANTAETYVASQTYGLGDIVSFWRKPAANPPVPPELLRRRDGKS